MHWARAQVSLSGTSYSRMRLLYELHCDGPQKMADLADGLGVTPRNVTALVDGLEVEGLVRRRDHPTDRRVTIIELTGDAPDAGGLFEAYRASVAGLFSTLSPHDQREYLRLTRLLDARLRAVDPPGGSERVLGMPSNSRLSARLPPGGSQAGFGGVDSPIPGSRRPVLRGFVRGVAGEPADHRRPGAGCSPNGHVAVIWR